LDPVMTPVASSLTCRHSHGVGTENPITRPALLQSGALSGP
jgi:hypothetical protein